MDNQSSQPVKFSVIVPVFNEEAVVEQVILDLAKFLEQNFEDSFEIIAVNDGSCDKSGQILSSINLANFRLIHHLNNKGYGASLKSGVKNSQGQFIAFFDSDGQHQPADLLGLLKAIDGYDMVVGSRQGYKGPAWRQLGKKLIILLANYLVSAKIPDLNSGLRVIRKEAFNKFVHLLPNGFSLTTTITLAFFRQGFGVKYLPIQVQKRQGKSSLKVSDGFRTILLVFRMIMLFSPLQVFLPVSLLFFIGGGISLANDIFLRDNINDATILLLVSAILIFLFGLLADQVASLRRELKL